MAMYDDILKQMQSSFTGMSPKRMGQPGGFMKPNFNYRTDDDPFGGGGSGGGAGGGGDDDNPGGGSGGGSGSGWKPLWWRYGYGCIERVWSGTG